MGWYKSVRKNKPKFPPPKWLNAEDVKMKKDIVIRIKEKIIEITREEEEKYLGMDKFLCICCVDNYRSLVNSRIRPNEIGYILENRIKKRLISRTPRENLDTRRRKTAKFFEKKFEYFVPYWKFGELAECKEKEIGRMFGCIITLR